MPTEILSYNQVKVLLGPNPHLLIGNGFSIACCPDIFTYRALLDEADFSDLSPHAKSAFGLLGTRDFELVINALVESSRLARHYQSTDENLTKALETDAYGLKEQLARTIAKRHPENPSKIEPSRYRACRAFLTTFDKIYSLNYDLLLYWTVMHEEDDLAPVAADDGFRRGDLGRFGYVKWDPLEAPSQSIYYLHGALHLFEQGSEFVKFTWKDTDIPLVQQIREALDHGRFPRIVSEGTSDEKLERIMHCAYLHKALRSLMSIGGDLVIFGMALTPNDQHILDCIVRGKVTRLFVSLHGDPKTTANREIISRAQLLATKRETHGKKAKPLEVSFFDAESAHLWV